MNNLINKISKWHKDRKITINGNSSTQTIKLGEEYGELCAAIVRNDKKEIKDALGDMVVVMVAIAELEGMTLNECIYSAYNEIKNREGILLPNGNFLKEISCKYCKYYDNEFCNKFNKVIEETEKCLFFEGRV